MGKSLLAAVAVLIAIGAWFLFGGNDAKQVAPVERADVALATQALPGRSGVALPNGKPVRAVESGAQREAVVEEPKVAAAAEVEAAFLPEDPDGELLEVFVEATGEPLPFAFVAVLGDRDGEEQKATAMMKAGRGLAAVFSEAGRLYRCDSEGRVHIRFENDRWTARAFGEIAGTSYAGFRRAPMGNRISVKASSGFDVHVMDWSGIAVEGAGVELRMVEADRREITIERAKTDAEGHALLAELPDIITTGGASTKVSVALGGYFQTGLEVFLDLEGELQRRFQFVRPPVGRIEVTAKDSNGDDLLGGQVVLGPDGVRLRPGAIDCIARSPRTRDSGERVYEFDAVERDVAFSLAFIAGDRKTIILKPGFRLGSEQEVLQIELVAGASEPMTGRVVDQAGLPLADVEIELGMRKSRRMASFESHERVRTDARGRFSAQLRWLTEKQVWFRAQLELGLVESEGISFDTDGAHDVGDVVLAPQRTLLAGRVVDEEGNGLVASVSMTSVSTRNEEGQWGPVSSWSGKSGMGGVFVIKGDCSAELLVVKASVDGYVLDGREHKWAPGTTDVELRMLKGARLGLFFPGLDELSKSHIGLILTRGENVVRAALQEDGLTKALPPGHWQLGIHLGYGDGMLLYSTLIELQAGKVTDLGLVALDTPLLIYDIKVNAFGAEEGVSVFLGDRPRWNSDVMFLAGGGPGESRLFSTVPIEQVRVSVGEQSRDFDVVEGLNSLQFLPE